MFNQINHIAIISSNYEASKKFYQDILQFELLFEKNRPEKQDIMMNLKVNDQTFIELFIKEDAPKRVNFPEAQGLRHLSFSTNNIEQDVAYLKSHQVKVEDIRTDDYTGEKMVFFFDPDGLPLELHE